ncbi:MAG: hypothetical protein AB9897_06585 [Anaerolineaceae bacterium]
MIKKGRFVAIIVIALILSVTTYAFAAANNVPATAAGDGSNTITGYTISAVTYTLDATNTTITAVSFNAVPDSTAPSVAPVFKVQIGGVSTSGWVTCTGTLPALTCTGTLGTVANAASLRIVASN